MFGSSGFLVVREAEEYFGGITDRMNGIESCESVRRRLFIALACNGLSMPSEGLDGVETIDRMERLHSRVILIIRLSSQKRMFTIKTPPANRGGLQ